MKHFNFIRLLTILLVLTLGLFTVACSKNYDDYDDDKETSRRDENTTSGDDTDNPDVPIVGGIRLIDFQNFVIVEFGSNDYNKYASPSVDFDEEKLNNAADQDALDKFNKSNQFFFGYEWQTLYDLLEVDFVEHYENVSNGDILKIKIVPDESLEDIGIKDLNKLSEVLNVKFASDEFEYTVGGLAEITAKTVDFSEILKFDFGKYNGFGYPELKSIDKTRFNRYINRQAYEAFANAHSKKIQAIFEETEDYIDLFNITIDQPYNHLSNGDKFYYSISLAPELRELGLTLSELCDGLYIKFNEAENFAVVEGLESPDGKILFDMLKELEQYVRFEGVDGLGSAYLDIPSDLTYKVGDYYIKYDSTSYYGVLYFNIIHENKLVCELACGVTDEEALSTGNLFSLYLYTYSGDLDSDGFDFASERYIIMVKENDLGKYLTLEQIQEKEILSKIQNYVVKEEDQSAYDKIYLCTLNSDAINNYKQKHGVVIVTYTSVWGITTYYCHAVRDIYMNPDGTIGGYISSVASDREWDDVIEELFAYDDYTYTEIS